jgi:hypothetical protein
LPRPLRVSSQLQPTITDSQFKLISRSLGVEMILLVALLLCASLMANGVGAR